MTHSLSELGYTAEYPIRYRIGAGLQGESFLVQLGDYLFESPASWFKAYGWDVSPGYTDSTALDFDRPVTADCLFCHSGNAEFADSDRRRLSIPELQPIGCDRCHGPGDAHRRHPTSANIVNPAKLSQAARDSVCEQCHLEGVTRVLNPSASWPDFHAGQTAETVFATYVMGARNSESPIFVTHTEQLAQSRCERGSQGRLWCGTCHDPHGDTQDRPREIAQICRSCHASISAAAHAPSPSECVSCHMPPTSTIDVAHAAITDHRILRRPVDREPARAKAEPTVIAWREPAPAFRARELALAETTTAFTMRSEKLRDDAIRKLEALPPWQQHNDFAVLTDLQRIYRQQRKPDLAIVAGQRAVELRPDSADAAMNLGLTLKQAGKTTDAEPLLHHAIDLDPSLKRAYSELVRLYISEGRNTLALETIDRFLQWNPRDIQFQIWKSQSSKTARP